MYAFLYLQNYFHCSSQISILGDIIHNCDIQDQLSFSFQETFSHLLVAIYFIDSLIKYQHVFTKIFSFFRTKINTSAFYLKCKQFHEYCFFCIFQTKTTYAFSIYYVSHPSIVYSFKQSSSVTKGKDILLGRNLSFSVETFNKKINR